MNNYKIIDNRLVKISTSEIAVIYSPSYGIEYNGYYDESQSGGAFNPKFALAILHNAKYPDNQIDLQEFWRFAESNEMSIEWVDKGDMLQFSAFDGLESVEVVGNISNYEVA